MGSAEMEHRRPFRVPVDEAAIADLHRRLDAVRWPEVQPPGAAWQWGTDADALKGLVHHWRERFEWRAWADRLNIYRQEMVRLAHGDIHVLIEPGSGRNPLPLILSHGWPGSVFELIDLVEPLAHPERFGGDAEDGFTIVLPSLPGFCFSPPPDRLIGPRETAAMWHALMTDVLGFERYGAHGGDIGSAITAWLAFDHPEPLVAIHMNNAVMRAGGTRKAKPLTPEEQAFVELQLRRLEGERAYQNVHGEKPVTIAYAFADSPVALAAWVLEKMHGWTTPAAPGLPPLDIDHMLADISAYWFGHCSPASWMYQALLDGSGYALPPGSRISVPSGFCLFPNDIASPPPRVWLERTFAVAHMAVHETGGHFPGIEQPALLTDDIRGFFRAYR